MPRARLAVLAAIAAALACAAPAAASDFVGMYSDDAFFGTATYRASALSAEVAAGVQIVRQPFDWRRIEVAPGSYDFRDYDDFVIKAAVAGLHVLPVLGDPPSFRAVTTTSDNLWSPPKSDADFATFADALVERYGPGGTLWTLHPNITPVPIHSWQIWNEPNLVKFWSTGPNAAAYTALLRAAHDAIKAVDPDAEVVAAGLPNSSFGVSLEGFLDGMFAAGAHGAFDTMALHAYAHDAPASVALVDLVRSVMTASGDDSPIWVTEVGWATGGPLSPFTTSEAQQAQNISDVIGMLADRRDALGVRGVMIFQWRDAVSAFDSWPLHTGLLRADGTAKPAYGAFVAAARALSPPVQPGDPPPPVPGEPGVTPLTGAGNGGRSTPAAATDDKTLTVVVARHARVAIMGGQMSRYGFMRVHLQCLTGSCLGLLKAGRAGKRCSGQRKFALAVGEAAVLRMQLRGKRARGCTHVLVTANTGPDDPSAAVFLPKRGLRVAPR